jgi:hypothetical protein
VALDLRAHRFRRAALLHAGRKGVREAARASGPRSCARVHRCRCSCCRYIVRAAVPVLRSTDRSYGAAAQDIAGDCPKYHASGDDRPDGISDIVSDGVPNGIPDRFTLSVCDSLSLRAGQHVSNSACQPRPRGGLAPSCGNIPRTLPRLRRCFDSAEVLRAAKRRADLLTSADGGRIDPSSIRCKLQGSPGSKEVVS